MLQGALPVEKTCVMQFVSVSPHADALPHAAGALSHVFAPCTSDSLSPPPPVRVHLV